MIMSLERENNKSWCTVNLTLAHYNLTPTENIEMEQNYNQNYNVNLTLDIKIEWNYNPNYNVNLTLNTKIERNYNLNYNVNLTLDTKMEQNYNVANHGSNRTSWWVKNQRSRMGVIKSGFGEKSWAYHSFTKYLHNALKRIWYESINHPLKLRQ